MWINLFDNYIYCDRIIKHWTFVGEDPFRGTKALNLNIIGVGLRDNQPEIPGSSYTLRGPNIPGFEGLINKRLQKEMFNTNVSRREMLW